MGGQHLDQMRMLQVTEYLLNRHRALQPHVAQLAAVRAVLAAVVLLWSHTVALFLSTFVPAIDLDILDQLCLLLSFLALLEAAYVFARRLYYQNFVPASLAGLSDDQYRLLCVPDEVKALARGVPQKQKPADASQGRPSTTQVHTPHGGTASRNNAWRQRLHDSPITSPVQQRGSVGSPFGNRLNESGHDHSGIFSEPTSPMTSPRVYRRSASFKSPTKHKGRVSDVLSLTRYLDTSQQNSTLANNDLSTPRENTAVYDMVNNLGTNLTRAVKYLTAVKPRTAPKAEKRDRDDLSGDEVWKHLRMSSSQVATATERCQMWITHAVLRPVAKEIRHLNTVLRNARLSSRIGSSSLTQIEKLHLDDPVALQRLLPFLRLHDAQDYLVGRFFALADQEGYNWQGGGDVKDLNGNIVSWKKGYPTDAEILFHSLCCFLNDPSTLYVPRAYDTVEQEARSFSSLHVIKHPETIDDMKRRRDKTQVYIFKTESELPHFKLVVQDTDPQYHQWNLAKGRNNLFHVVVALLRFVRLRQNGRMDYFADRSLEQHDLNMLWIVD